MPREAQPESAIEFLSFKKSDASDHLLRLCFQTQAPMPGFAALHGRQSHITIEDVHAIQWIRPRNILGEIPHDLPLREQELRLSSICQFQRTKHQPMRSECGNHRSDSIV